MLNLQKWLLFKLVASAPNNPNMYHSKLVIILSYLSFIINDGSLIEEVKKFEFLYRDALIIELGRDVETIVCLNIIVITEQKYNISLKKI